MKKFITCLALAVSLFAGNVWADRAQYVPDIVVTEPGAVWTDSRAYSTIALAFESMNAKDGGGTLLISQDYSLASSLSLDSDVTLKFTPGSVITLNGKTLTILGEVVAGRQQIFSGAGVTFNGNTHDVVVFPEWWGAVVDDDETDQTAIQYAINSLDTTATTYTGGTVSFTNGDYSITTGLTASTAGTQLIGQGPTKSRILREVDGGNINMITFTDGGNVVSDLCLKDVTSAGVVHTTRNGFAIISVEDGDKFRNLRLEGGGISITTASYWTISDVSIYSPGVGLYVTGADGTTSSIEGYVQKLDVFDSSSYGIHLNDFVDACTFVDVTVEYSNDIALYCSLVTSSGSNWFYMFTASGGCNSTAGKAAIILGGTAGSSHFIGGHIETGNPCAYDGATQVNYSAVDYGVDVQTDRNTFIDFNFVAFPVANVRLLNADNNKFIGCRSWGAGLDAGRSGGTQGYNYLIQAETGKKSKNNQFIGCYAYDEQSELVGTSDYGWGIVEGGTGIVSGTKLTNCVAEEFYGNGYYLAGIALDPSARIVGSSMAQTEIEYAMISDVTPVATTPYTILNAESGKTFTNAAATAIVTFNLPTPTTTGLIYTFVVLDDDGIYIEPGAYTIYYNSMAASARLTSTTLYDSITLRSIDANGWEVVAIVAGDGDFTDEVWTDAN